MIEFYLLLFFAFEIMTSSEAYEISEFILSVLWLRYKEGQQEVFWGFAAHIHNPCFLSSPINFAAVDLKAFVSHVGVLRHQLFCFLYSTEFSVCHAMHINWVKRGMNNCMKKIFQLVLKSAFSDLWKEGSEIYT